MRGMIASLLISVAGSLIAFWASTRFPSLTTATRGTLVLVVGVLVLVACLLVLRQRRQATAIAVASGNRVAGSLGISDTEIAVAEAESVSVGSGNKVGGDMTVGHTKIAR
ncbi:MAG: hypothetical protein KKI08_10955 [Armatimonadetes bacterium]|nr:hypothetical protein [Armatimonadota bacterium]